MRALRAAALLLGAVASARLMAGPATRPHSLRGVSGLATGGLCAAGLAVSAAIRLGARWAGSGLEADLLGAAIASLFFVTMFVLPARVTRERASGS